VTGGETSKNVTGCRGERIFKVGGEKNNPRLESEVGEEGRSEGKKGGIDTREIRHG